MSCHRGWCFVSFRPLGASSSPLEPRLSVLPEVGIYGIPCDRISCEGLVKGPLVCYFHLRVSCVGGKETRRTVVFRMWPRGRALGALNLSFRTLMVLE